jgi:hypothetical protein
MEMNARRVRHRRVLVLIFSVTTLSCVYIPQGTRAPAAAPPMPSPEARLSLVTFTVQSTRNGELEPDRNADDVRKALEAAAVARRLVRSDLDRHLRRGQAHVAATFEETTLSSPWRPWHWLSIATLTVLPTWSVDQTRLELAVTRETGPTMIYSQEERVTWLVWLPLFPGMFWVRDTDQDLLATAIGQARSAGTLP